jgi:hypothetical protein
MRTAEAEELGQKLATSFPRSSVSIHAWTEQLIECERGPAEAAVRNLIRTSEHPPTIAHFWTAYRGVHKPLNGDEIKCERCFDTGYVTDTNHPHHWPGQPERIPVLMTEDGAQHDECICNVVTICPNCGTYRRLSA